MNQKNNTAWIVSCKSSKAGYIVNDTISIPNDPANRHCADVLAWIAEGNTPAPDFTDAEIAVNAQAVTNATSQAYLASTDWYVIRHAEKGVAIPDDITSSRQKAREAIEEAD